MLVNIIMPAYNGHETIRQAVASVAMQDHSDEILLTIVDDCSDIPYDYIIDDFRYIKIEILTKPTNTGCGQSRQYGIDRCKCKYFMFLDTDDCLYSPIAVKQMYSFMEREDLDLLYTSFIEELKDGRYLTHKNSGIWMHGKMFKTKYIQENDIRYNETRVNEDHAFNTISLLSGGKNMYIDCITYLWRYYEKSLTRHDESIDDFSNSMRNFVVNAKYTISELIKRNVPREKIYEILKKYILSFYKCCNIMMNNNMPNRYTKKFMKDITEFLNSIPCKIRDNVTEESLLEGFYQDDSIRSMIDTNILFVVTFHKYYMDITRELLN